MNSIEIASCPVCLTAFNETIPYVACENGHLMCADCHVGITKTAHEKHMNGSCPVCREQLCGLPIPCRELYVIYLNAVPSESICDKLANRVQERRNEMERLVQKQADIEKRIAKLHKEIDDSKDDLRQSNHGRDHNLHDWDEIPGPGVLLTAERNGDTVLSSEWREYIRSYMERRRAHRSNAQPDPETDSGTARGMPNLELHPPEIPQETQEELTNAQNAHTHREIPEWAVDDAFAVDQFTLDQLY
jgi:hypothetical protein